MFVAASTSPRLASAGMWLRRNRLGFKLGLSVALCAHRLVERRSVRGRLVFRAAGDQLVVAMVNGQAADVFRQPLCVYTSKVSVCDSRWELDVASGSYFGISLTDLWQELRACNISLFMRQRGIERGCRRPRVKITFNAPPLWGV